MGLARGVWSALRPPRGRSVAQGNAARSFYDPHAIKAEAGKTLEVSVTLVPEPTRANDPVIKKVGFFPLEARQGR